MIYASESRSLAALEILVHFSAVPRNFVLTEVELPDDISMLRIEAADLPAGWDAETISEATQNIGEHWAAEDEYPVLSVPSSIVVAERNYVLNPAHPDFPTIRFLPSTPFRFDPRLK